VAEENQATPFPSQNTFNEWIGKQKTPRERSITTWEKRREKSNTTAIVGDLEGSHISHLKKENTKGEKFFQGPEKGKGRDQESESFFRRNESPPQGETGPSKIHALLITFQYPDKDPGRRNWNRSVLRKRKKLTD